MDQDFIAADKQYRNRFLLITIGIIIVLSLILCFVFPAFQDWLTKMEPEKGMKVIATALFILFILPIPLGFKMLSISNRILRDQCYPPEGMRVLFDTNIIRGDKAKLRAYVFLLLAFLIFFISIFCAFSVQIFLKILTTTRSFT